MAADESHPAHADHPNMAVAVQTSIYYEGDRVFVFDPDHPDAHPHTDWKPATVIEMCDDGDIAVRYDEGEEVEGEIEEEVAPDDIRLLRRGVAGRAANAEAIAAKPGKALPPLKRPEE